MPVAWAGVSVQEAGRGSALEARKRVQMSEMGRPRSRLLGGLGDSWEGAVGVKLTVNHARSCWASMNTTIFDHFSTALVSLG